MPDPALHNVKHRLQPLDADDPRGPIGRSYPLDVTNRAIAKSNRHP
jgi:hypothetical protein